MSRKQIFFTLNGRFLGTAFSNIELQKDQVYPAVCLQAFNEEVSTNFFSTVLDPFVYDIESLKNDIIASEFN
jgi:hypothetical protein